jgi:hemolysin activation/secretion protein
MALALCCLAVPAAAQQQSGDTTQPGQIEKRIEETVTDQKRLDERREPVPAPLNVPAAKPAPEKPRTAFTLAAVTISGMTVFTPAELAPLYEEFLATRITDAEAAEIARRVTQKYVDAGYILSRAVVPPQQIVTGALQLRVVEGYAAEVRIDGLDPDRFMIRPFTRRITEARPLRLAHLERAILLIEDSAGITVERSHFDQGDDSGAYTLNMTLSHDTIDASLYADNRGTPAVGRSQLWLSSGVNQLLGIGERAQAGVFTVPTQPQELQYGELRYSQPIGGDGLQVTLTGSYTAVDGGSNQAQTDTESDTRRGVVQLAYPLVRARLFNIWLNGFLDYRDSSEDQFDRLNYDDRLRVARLRANVTVRDNWNGTSWAIGTVSKGLDIFGASTAGSPALSRFDGEPEFVKFYLDIGRTQDIGQNYAIEISAIGQKSNRPLLSSEEIGIGGSRFGRAYDFAEITGDDGLAGSVELRRVFRTDDADLDDIQLYGFYDVGAVWNRNAARAEFSRQSLSSTGIGVRAAVLGAAQVSAEIAKPLTRPVFTSDNDNGLRAFFSLSANF